MTKPPIKGASIAHPREGDRLFAPSAARNADAITTLLTTLAPPTGIALEIASGTGQHIVQFAKQMPNITWYPTEVGQSRLASIASYQTEANLPNIAAPQLLDATTPGWSEKHAPKDLIFLANLLHLISTPSAKTLIAEAAKTLAPNGQFVIYGPFMRNGQLTSPGDAQFHKSLTDQDPDIGYKDTADIIATAQTVGLAHVQTNDLPANNLALRFRKAS